jgi:hypothetical protein
MFVKKGETIWISHTPARPLLHKPALISPHHHPHPQNRADIILANVVLVNLLVAMMGDTYSRVKEKADSQWMLERTRIILQIEATMSAADRLSEANKYYGLHPRTGTPFLQSESCDMEHFRASKQTAAVLQATREVQRHQQAMLAAYAVPKPTGGGNGGGAGTGLETAVTTPKAVPSSRVRRASVVAAGAAAAVPRNRH